MINNEKKAWLMRYDRACCKVQALKGTKECSKALQEQQKILHEIVQAIDRIEDSLASKVLYQRFVRCESWKQIARILDYSQSTIYRKYKIGLKQIEIDLQTNKS